MSDSNSLIRCGWVSNDPLYQHYHDHVWGVPVMDSQELFAKLCLDGQQAGLSWITILKKQKNYEEAFLNFDPEKVSLFDEKDVERLLLNPGIVRNKLKVNSIIRNARAYLKMQEQGIDFVDFIWSFVDHKTKQNEFKQLSHVPATSEQSDAMSKALKKAGFNFVGSTICYAFMQAVGLVNDHTTDCHCYEKVRALGRK